MAEQSAGEQASASGFNVGDIVHDRDADEQSAAYVTTLPDATADEWIAYEETTVAEDNPDYPPDARVVVVVHTTNVHYDLPNWNRYTPLSVSEIEEADALYYAFPAPRLVRDQERPHAPENQRARAESGDEPDESSDDQPSTSTLTDIQHVGESRAGDLRAAGYESVEDIASTDQSALAGIEGIGSTRAAHLTASASDLLGGDGDASEADTRGESETDGTESRDTPESSAPSAALVALQRYLESDGMEADIAADGQSVRVRESGESYRVNVEGVLEGDGPHRSQLEETVEKLRAAL